MGMSVQWIGKDVNGRDSGFIFFTTTFGGRHHEKPLAVSLKEIRTSRRRWNSLQIPINALQTFDEDRLNYELKSESHVFVTDITCNLLISRKHVKEVRYWSQPSRQTSHHPGEQFVSQPSYYYNIKLLYVVEVSLLDDPFTSHPKAFE
jgi:hypothetical protein